MLALNHTQSSTGYHPARHKDRPLASHMTESLHRRIIKSPYKLPNTEDLHLEWGRLTEQSRSHHLGDRQDLAGKKLLSVCCRHSQRLKQCTASLLASKSWTKQLLHLLRGIQITRLTGTSWYIRFFFSCLLNLFYTWPDPHHFHPSPCPFPENKNHFFSPSFSLLYIPPAPTISFFPHFVSEQWAWSEATVCILWCQNWIQILQAGWKVRIQVSWTSSVR